MAAKDGPEDYDALLAEVERSLQAGAPHPSALPAAGGAGGGASASAGRRRRSALPAKAAREVARAEAERLPAGTRALLAGGAAAVLVFLVFSLLPFLSGLSGAAGAFLGAAAVALVLRRR